MEPISIPVNSNCVSLGAKAQRSMDNELVRASKLSNEICISPTLVSDATFKKFIIEYVNSAGTKAAAIISYRKLELLNFNVPYPPLDRSNHYIVVRVVYQHRELRFRVKCNNWALHIEDTTCTSLKGWIGTAGEMQIIRPFRIFQGQSELAYFTTIMGPREDANIAFKTEALKCFSIEIRLSHVLKLKSGQIRLSYNKIEDFFSELQINTISWQDILVPSLDAAPTRTKQSAIISTKKAIKEDAKLAILMPIYNGIPETVNALNSLRQYFKPKVGLRIRLILGLDNPNNHLMTSAIQANFGRVSNIQIIENPANLGFIGNCNNMFSLVEADEEVLLLNSDIIAPSSNWIERLLQCGRNDLSIGTITPLSNQASIFSFPLSNQTSQSLPLELDIDEVDHLLQTTCSAYKTLYCEEVPSCHGFCTLILNSRLRLDHLFDPSFGKGYGEENDLSIVIKARGLKNVCYPSVYVYHHESVSFNDDKTELLESNLKLLGNRYKTYHQAVRHYCLNDPLRLFKAKAILCMLEYRSQKTCKSYTLHVCHERGGGTHSFIEAYCRNHPSENHLLLTPGDSQTASLKLYIISVTKNNFSVNCIGAFYANELGTYVHTLRDVGIASVILHSLIDFPAFGPINLYTMLLSCIPSAIYIHDYQWICLNENLLVNKDRYIGPNAPDLIHDLSQLSTQKGYAPLFTASNSSHIRRMKLILNSAGTIVAPSYCASDLVQSRTKLAKEKFIVSYHDDSTEFASCQEKPVFSTIRHSPVNVAVIGAIGANKGYRSLEQLVRYADASNQMIRFVFIGYTLNDQFILRSKNAEIVGKYDERDFSSLVKKYSVDCSLFLSPWPETYSYTLSLAFKEKIWPFVYDIGAPAERVKASGFGSILTNSKAPYICSEITSFFRCNNSASAEISQI